MSALRDFFDALHDFFTDLFSNPSNTVWVLYSKNDPRWSGPAGYPTRKAGEDYIVELEKMYGKRPEDLTLSCQRI